MHQITKRRLSRYVESCVVLVALGMASCAILPSIHIQKTRKVQNLLEYREKDPSPREYRNSEFGSPRDHTLAFAKVNEGISRIYMTQVNPKMPPVHADLGLAGQVDVDPFMHFPGNEVFFAPPVPVGSKMQLTYLQYVGGSGLVLTYVYGMDRAINSHDEFAFIAEKPGLLYLGNYYLKDGADGPTGLTRSKDYSELSCLRMLLGRLRKTEWEPVIKARIKELTK
jgi:hypothetical protein